MANFVRQPVEAYKVHCTACETDSPMLLLHNESDNAFADNWQRFHTEQCNALQIMQQRRREKKMVDESFEE